ncbi:MAG: hypothetical protein HQL73_10155, partial [Magnetococcales bacterium]|nr:hypothetical protein [Magnetococcales bacterium]
MTTIADRIAQDFGHHYRTFHSPEVGNIVDVCSRRAQRIAEEFGKKKFVFADASAIGMGDGQWFVGFGDCFCNAAHGHHPQCPGNQAATQQP